MPSGEQIKIKAKSNDDATRYLGVWYNSTNYKRFTTQLIHDQIDDTKHILATKSVSDNQIRYCINSVLMPSILHKLRHVVLTRTELDLIDSKLRGVFKAAAHLPRSMPTHLIHNHAFYGIDSIISKHAALHIENAIRSFQKRGAVGDIMNFDACTQ